MSPEEHSRMNHLCELIAVEKDHRKFLDLIRELNGLLERKQQRLNPDTDTTVLSSAQ
jgi:hypothetical protein